MQHLVETLHHQRFYTAKQEEVMLDIALTLCNNPTAYGITRAQKLGIKCQILPHKNFASREAFDEAMAQSLCAHHIEYIFLAGFMRILTPAFIQKFSIINIHPSFLPEHKGAQGIKDSFYSHAHYGGVSVHWVSEELDSGEIILQEKVAKIPNESLEDFERRIHECEYALYPRAILYALGLHKADSSLFYTTSTSFAKDING